MKNYGIRVKKIFCIYDCFSVSRYTKEGIKIHLRYNWIFKYTGMYKQPTLTSSGIIIFLCKYYRVISDTLVGSFLDAFFLLFTVILLELQEKPRRKDWVAEKNT